MLNPYLVGSIYGTVLGVDKENIGKQVVEEPISTTVEIMATSALYGVTTDVVSELLIPEGGKNVLLAVLLGVAGYKLYKFCKKYKNKKTD